MKTINVSFSEEEYKIFTRFLYFADYCSWNGLIAEFKNGGQRQILSELISRIYKISDQLEGTRSISLNSMADKVPFSEEDNLKQMKRVEIDLNNISYHVFAQKFAERDLNLPRTDGFFEREGGWAVKHQLIAEKKQPYLREFQENDISNLRFKIFYKLTREDP